MLESLAEEKLLLQHLHMKDTLFNATHKTNALILKGKLPEHKHLLLEKIDQALGTYDPKTMRNKELSKWNKWSLE